MEKSVRIRLGIAAPVLGFVYFKLLILIVGWTSTRIWPSWWIGVFPNRHVAALIWLICLHTAAVSLAALPTACAVVAIVRERALLLGVIVGVIATALALLPAMRPDMWRLAWSSHPIFFITDQIKLLAAVPLAAWIILKLTAASCQSPPKASGKQVEICLAGRSDTAMPPRERCNSEGSAT